MLRRKAPASMHGLSSSTNNCRLWVDPPKRPHSSGNTPDNKFDDKSMVRSCVMLTHISGKVPGSDSNKSSKAGSGRMRIMGVEAAAKVV
jgi:hypothetical protein